jgi:hypothetical protein
VTGAFRPVSASEAFAWLVPVLMLAGLYAIGALGLAPDSFGINALRKVPAGTPALIVVAASFVAAAATIADSRGSTRWVDSYVIAAAVAMIAGVLMFAGRSEFLNPDGHMFAPKFAAAVPVSGAFVTHDEMLEFLVHSRLWAYTNAWWGWSVGYSYQVTSSVAGSIFVFLAFRLAGRVAPAAPGLFLAGVMSGAYMQLFFGDVENYTLTAVVVTAYLLSAARFLRGEAPLWEPAVALALAMSFHLLAGWLLPSLAYLGYLSWRRTGDRGPLLRSAWLGAGVIVVTVVLVHFYGAPIWSIGSSHAGQALRLKDVFVTEWSAAYYAEQANLVILLTPAILAVPIAAWWRRLTVDEMGDFLSIAAGSMFVFQVVWKAQIGVYNDWNLFAIGGLVTSVLIWRTVSLSMTSRWQQALAASLAVLGALHSYAWIAANHVHGR